MKKPKPKLLGLMGATAGGRHAWVMAEAGGVSFRIRKPFGADTEGLATYEKIPQQYEIPGARSVKILDVPGEQSTAAAAVTSIELQEKAGKPWWKKML